MPHDLQKLYEHIDDIEIAMMTTRRPDGHLCTADDPRIVLVGVEIHSAQFLEVNKPQPVVLFEMVKGLVTGQQVELGRMHKVGDLP